MSKWVRVMVLILLLRYNLEALQSQYYLCRRMLEDMKLRKV